jgi:3,4-dihydroxy 2-butanone 4-phosphate synthase/GTP cyclohydrolase II
MARLPDLERFGAEHRVRIVTVEDIVRWRLRHEHTVEVALETDLPVRGLGSFRLRVFRTSVDSGLHYALSRGDLVGGEPPLVRVQSCCLPGDVFHSLTCDCGAQLEAYLMRIAEQDRGVVLYLHHHESDEPEPRLRRLRAHLQPRIEAEDDAPVRTGEQELRNFGVGAQILSSLGVRELRLLTNNPRKIVALEGFGLEVVDRLPLQVAQGSETAPFLEAQRQRLGHLV